VLDSHYVMIDGQTRRKKCNIKHLEPLNQIAQVSQNAPVPEVVRVLKELGIELEDKKPKAKTKPKAERPKRTRRKKENLVKEAKSAKISKKKAEKTEKPTEKKADEAEKEE
jgi:ribosomal protein L14E/L6E/L27E